MTSGRTTRNFFVALVASAAIACGTGAGVDDAEGSSAEQAIAESLADENAPLLVKDPRTLVALEAQGFTLAKLLKVNGSTGQDFMASADYKRIAANIDHDLKVLRVQDPRSGPGIEFAHRQFDPRWLGSPESRFELVAVVNRLDRRTATDCGEFRLIYRFAYTATRSASRLPLTLNVVFPQADDGKQCATVAQRWLDAKIGSAEALAAGPLAKLPPIKQIELNYQAVRWPSNERPDMGGHAEYILRIFKASPDGFMPSTLENTPRTDLSDADREELRGWIRDHLADIDQGTAILPDKFLANEVTSIAPRGPARMANQPYTQLFSDVGAAFGDLPFAGTKQIKSPAALVRRLDTMTCHGCHQSRSIAGFHLLGEERDPAARLNALAIGRSPHMNEELVWRTALVAAVAAGTPFTAPRPFAEHASESGKYGNHCGLGDPGFATWTCAEGLQCLDVHGDVVGMCTPPGAPVGNACETVHLTPNPDSHHDHAVGEVDIACDEDGQNAKCDQVANGFPDGMCRADCADAAVGTVTGTTVCGLIPDAQGLTSCLAAHTPFQDCLASQNAATILRTCDATENCRDDYACARVKNGPAGVGACMPPYFAFEARVDGHLFDNL